MEIQKTNILMPDRRMGKKNDDEKINFSEKINQKEEENMQDYRHVHGHSAIAKMINSGNFDVDFYREITEYTIPEDYSDEIVEIIKKIGKKEIKDALRKTHENHEAIAVYEDDDIKIYPVINQNQSEKKLKEGIIEFDFLPVKTLKSKRFGNIEIHTDVYLEKNIDFFNKLENANKVELLTDDKSEFHTLIKVDDAVTSIQTFLEVSDFGFDDDGAHILDKTERILKKFNIDFEYKKRTPLK